jgi:hypothetical protein
VYLYFQVLHFFQGLLIFIYENIIEEFLLKMIIMYQYTDTYCKLSCSILKI